MNPEFVKIPGLAVRVDNVMYLPTLETPSDKPYAFVYFLAIVNTSDVVVTVKARKWVVTEEGGETIVVEGPGVVGETPTLGKGEEFSYNSCHVVAHNAVAKGALFGTTADGQMFSVDIPEFTMEVPD